MKPLRVGIVGCGYIAQTVHIPAYIENPKSKLVAICDANKERLDEFARKYNIEETYLDYRELLQSGSVDAVSVCTPTALHSKVAIESAKNGIHVLCEKPLASNLKEAEEIAQAVHQSNIKFMVGFNYRFLPNHAMSKKLVDTGKIGKPLLIRGIAVTPGPYRADIDSEDLSNEAKKRIGAFFDIGSHLVDLFVWMMGKPSEVYATFSSRTNNTDVDDSATALIRFQSNVLGSATVSWVNLPDYKSASDSRMIEIVGTQGKINSEFLGPSLYFYGSNTISSKIRGMVKISPGNFNPKVPDEALKWSYKKEIDCFLESIVRDEKPPVTLEHALQVLETVVAAYDSAKRKSSVNLEK